MPRTVNGTGQSETEPTSRAVPTPPDEADNATESNNGDSEFKKKLQAWLELAWPFVKTEEDRQKIIRVLLEAQAELFSVGLRGRDGRNSGATRRLRSATRK